jgi:pimeloyl-ACP methyl ester carboxylesterase
MTTSAFVLVHGGWHGGWCWERLERILRDDGHPVHAPTLSGDPRAGLATHVDEVVGLLKREDLQDVVLVGHSSGGAVITGVAQRAGERLSRLSYVDAFVPQPGMAVFDLLPEARRAHFRSLVDDTGRIVLDPDTAMDGWGLRDPDDRSWVGLRLRPYPLGGLADPLPPDPVPDLPRHYVHCTDKPSGDAFACFAATARPDPAWVLDTLDTGHDAMVTAPADLARVLLRRSAG